MSEKYEGHYDGLNEGAYIKAAEFKLGQQFTVTIDAVHREELEGEDGKKKKKGVVTFEGKAKGWVSNKTNQILIAAMFGPMVRDWHGKRVTLAVENVRVGTETKVGFRVVGSPDLAAPISAEVKLPRRKAITRKLVPTGKGTPPTKPATRTDTPPLPEPPPDYADSDSLTDQPPEGI